jgi:N-methylhydantoinase A
VIVPPNPALFSAIGLLSTDVIYTESRSAYFVFTPEIGQGVDRIYSQMQDDLLQRLGLRQDEVTIIRTFDGRLVGQTWETPFIPVPDGTIDGSAIQQMIQHFHETYEQRFGHRFDEVPVQGVTYRVQIALATEKLAYSVIDPALEGAPEPGEFASLAYLENGPSGVPVFHREHLCSGHRIEGPALIREETSTTLVGPGQVAAIGAHSEIVIRLPGYKHGPGPQHESQ